MTDTRMDTLFGHLNAMYGVNKVGAMFAQPGLKAEQAIAAVEAAKGTWGNALSRYSGPVLAKALRGLIDQGREWPPTLPEFVALCKDAMRAEAQPYVALPPATADRIKGEQAARKLRAVSERVGQADPMFWAKYPKSAKAVELMVRGSQRSWPLTELIQQHIADGGVNCRSEEARKAIQWLAEQQAAKGGVAA